MKSLKLVIPDKELKDFSRFKGLKLNLNGHKPRKRNLYRKQLNRLRKVFR